MWGCRRRVQEVSWEWVDVVCNVGGCGTDAQFQVKISTGTLG